jgi:hypothetical protein
MMSITLMRSFTVYVAINVKPLCVGVRNMATIEERKSVAESRSRHQIPKRHRGHQNVGSPRRLIDLVTQSSA